MIRDYMFKPTQSKCIRKKIIHLWSQQHRLEGGREMLLLDLVVQINYARGSHVFQESKRLQYLVKKLGRLEIHNDQASGCVRLSPI